MRSLFTFLCIFLLAYSGECCLSTNQRAFSAGQTVQQFAPLPPPEAPPQPAPALGAGLRPVAAAANKGPTEAIAQQSLINHLLGRQVSLHEFDSNGYNAEGGGPVTAGEALSCDFDRRPCCWANVPPPDDQLDWQLANGAPESGIFKDAPIPNGNYLVAHANSAAPSDEAQFASCAIGCASSPIVVRARHWQSENVLLQVCQRESFPSTVNFNPLLNCQEFPLVSGLGATELVLPKASLVDIVFVASNFVGESGDVAILDDIEVVYESDGDECGSEQREVKQETNEVEKLAKKDKLGDLNGRALHKEITVKTSSGERSQAKAVPSVGGSEEGSAGIAVETVEESKLGASRALGIKTSSLTSCQHAKCSFEAGTTCHYKDAHQTQSIRGLTTRFQVVTGQFMNRVTGVKEGTEGDFYAATFLFPREMAGLAVELKNLTEPLRMRFQYYEGTHGVQLKGCCDNLENCLFRSDRFVSVSDRTWKLTEFTCPVGTSKILFVCENTRTNQGACALDDIQVIESTTTDVRSARAIC